VEEDDKKIKGGLTGSIRKPIHIPGKRVMITKNMILEAQKHTISNMAAARWMGIQYNTYKKYAKEFGVFEQHLNPTGKGIKSKGWGSYRANVEDIVLGKRNPPRRWSHSVVKQQLIEKGYWMDECSICGYNETNLHTEKVCLGIDFMDDNHQNWLLENIRLLCPNCYLSFNGWFEKSKRFCK
jgi:hypothetical protein|tara:strand:+ start:2236 stop:2781 length:546 start_codon:yes stop_codon:yes gene_type:complete